jgi:restriction endonuclease S subunit
MKNISQEAIAGLSILRPSLEEQRLIVQVLNEASEVLIDEQQHRDKLIAKKKGLMDDLLTGRVRVGAVRLDEVLGD